MPFKYYLLNIILYSFFFRFLW